MKLSWYSPMPPERSGVAVYSSELIKYFNKSDISINPRNNRNSNINVYSIGNHPLHDSLYERMLEFPGIVLVHDLNIHDLIYYRTAGRGGYLRYVNYLLNEEHISSDDVVHLLYTDFPAKYHYFRKYDLIRETALHNNFFIVHTEHAKRTILSINADANILRVNHFSSWSQQINRDAGKKVITIGIFGYISENRHIAEIIHAFADFIAHSSREYRIIIAGTDTDAVAEHAVDKWAINDRVKIIQYPSDDKFLDIMKYVDYGINIRYPHNGEVSGNMIKMMGFGIPVAANATDADFPQNTYFPVDTCNIGESLKAFFSTMDNDPVQLHEIGQHAYNFIEKQCNVQHIARDIETFIHSYRDKPVHNLKKFRKQRLMTYFSLRDKIKIIMGRKG